MDTKKITFSFSKDAVEAFRHAQDAMNRTAEIVGVYAPKPMHVRCLNRETGETVNISRADLERFSDRFTPLSQEAIEQVECDLHSQVVNSRFVPNSAFGLVPRKLYEQQEKEIKERFYGKSVIAAKSLSSEEIERQLELLNEYERSRLVKRQDEVPEGSHTVQMILD